MVWVCYSSSSTCLAFVAALLRLFFFAVLCHLLLWGHKTTPGWFYHPKGVVLSPKRGGFILFIGFIPHLGVVLYLQPHQSHGPFPTHLVAALHLVPN